MTVHWSFEVIEVVEVVEETSQRPVLRLSVVRVVRCETVALQRAFSCWVTKETYGWIEVMARTSNLEGWSTSGQRVMWAGWLEYVEMASTG